MLDKNKPMVTHLGELVDGVKWVQNGSAYGTNGRFLGKFSEGRLHSLSEPEATDEPETPKPAPLLNLDDMSRKELLEYAKEELGVKLKGNLSADALRLQIAEL